MSLISADNDETRQCQHFHASNYDPAKVVGGQPVEVLPEGQLWCFDCKEFFWSPIYPMPPKSYTLAEIDALAREWSSEPTDSDAVSHVEEDLSIGLTLSLFLAWLKQREKEGGR